MFDLSTVKALIASIVGLFPSVPRGISLFIGSIIDQLPLLAASGGDTIAFFTSQMVLVRVMLAEHRDPSDAEWDALNAVVSDELAKLRKQGAE